METLNTQKIIMPRVAVRFDSDRIRNFIPDMLGHDRSLFEAFLAYLVKEEERTGREAEFVGSIVSLYYETLLMRDFKFETPLDGCPSQISVKFVSNMSVLK